MITKIGNKKQYKPYATDGKTSVVMWDFQPVIKNGVETEIGTWKIERFNKVMLFADVKEFILDYYNQKIDEKILSGMMWNGMKVWLSSENQFNYKAAYDLAVQTNGANLPVVFKFGETHEPQYYKFTNMEEFSDFYMKTMAYIQKTLAEGWEFKDSINWEVYE